MLISLVQLKAALILPCQNNKASEWIDGWIYGWEEVGAFFASDSQGNGCHSHYYQAIILQNPPLKMEAILEHVLHR